jgi:hypothetical protein
MKQKILFWLLLISTLIAFGSNVVASIIYTPEAYSLGGMGWVFHTYLSLRLWSSAITALLLVLRKNYAWIPFVIGAYSTAISSYKIITRDVWMGSWDWGWTANVIAAYASVAMLVLGIFYFFSLARNRFTNRQA